MSKKLRYVLTLETATDDGPDSASIHRLRALLKRLARGHGFRCVEVRPTVTPEAAELQEPTQGQQPGDQNSLQRAG